jgi:hypothetical protein
MPHDQYVTVTLKKEIVREIKVVNPNKPISVSITDAILDYLEKSKQSNKVQRKTPDLPYPELTGTTTI